MRILGIETSCDETSASVLSGTGDSVKLESLVILSQDIHRVFGGVVPEIASRQHLTSIIPVVDRSLVDAGVSLPEVDAIAVTHAPGLVGALLVGVAAAKGLCMATGIPLVGVHHLEGHLFATSLEHPDATPPFIALLVSGGHTMLLDVPRWGAYELLGATRDDAAGEAFDKTAKLLGFPYPGGRWIDETAAQGGDPAAFDFPRALPQKATLDFSFSGLKTAVSLKAEELRKKGELEARLPDLCASTQEAIVDALYAKMAIAIRENRCQALAIVGGVAANSRLRSRLTAEWKSLGLALPPILPEMRYCTDNAAMIAGAGAFRYRQGNFLRGTDFLTLNAFASPEF